MIFYCDKNFENCRGWTVDQFKRISYFLNELVEANSDDELIEIIGSAGYLSMYWENIRTYLCTHYHNNTLSVTICDFGKAENSEPPLIATNWSLQTPQSLQYVLSHYSGLWLTNFSTKIWRLVAEALLLQPTYHVYVSKKHWGWPVLTACRGGM